MSRRELCILVTTCFGHSMSHINVLVFPSLLLPLSVRLGLPLADVIGISFWMYLLFGITALPWGVAADRWGARPLMAVFYLGSALSGLLVARSIDSPGALLWALAALGLFSGIYHPTGLGLISKEIERLSMAMGYNGMAGSSGLAAAPLITGLLNFFWGESAPFLFIAGMNLLGFALMVLFPLSQSERGKKADKDDDNGMLTAFLILLAAMMLAGIAYRSATVILPAYFEIKGQGIFQWLSSTTGWELSKNLVATLVTSLIYLIGVAGQYTGGRVAERFDPRFCYLVFHGITVPMVLLMAITWDLPLVILALVYVFFLLGMQPIENTLVANFSPRRFHHSAYGTKFVVTFGVAALAVKMVGAIEAAFRIEAVFTTMGLISLALVGVIGLLIRHTQQRVQSSAFSVQE